MSNMKFYNPYKADREVVVVPDWVSSNPNITDGALRLYIVLRRYAGKNGIAWPSQKTLAREMHLKEEKTVQRRADVLIKEKVIHVENRTGQPGKQNLYRFVMPPQDVPRIGQFCPDESDNSVPFNQSQMTEEYRHSELGPLNKGKKYTSKESNQPPSEKTVSEDGTVRNAIIETVASCERFAEQAPSMNGTATSLAKDLLKMCSDTDQIEYELHGWRDWHNENPKNIGTVN